jgi:CDP-diacylglycerol--glycerol-3-phosphate 3-phosphatidyltransferase
VGRLVSGGSPLKGAVDNSLDILCSCAVLLFVAATGAMFGLRKTLRRSTEPGPNDVRASGLPRVFTSAALWALSPFVRAVIFLGLSANAVTAISLVAGGLAGFFLACGHFGVAAVLFATASLGDALDGLVARATRTESAAGALFDASVDRYEEFFAFGGLAIYFRSSGVLLALMLLALVGSFMVSYGSAKAEALRVPVPIGSMRRAERATCLAMGTTLVPIVGAASARLHGPTWVGEIPVLLAIAVIAVAANLSAVRRLRDVAAAVSPPPAPVRERTPRATPVPVDARAHAE